MTIMRERKNTWCLRTTFASYLSLRTLYIMPFPKPLYLCSMNFNGEIFKVRRIYLASLAR